MIIDIIVILIFFNSIDNEGVRIQYPCPNTDTLCYNTDTLYTQDRLYIIIYSI